MPSKRTIKIFAVIFVGLGLPAYFKTKFALAGIVPLSEIFKPINIITDVAFSLIMAALVIGTHDGWMKVLRDRLSGRERHLKRFIIQVAVTSVNSLAVVYLFFRFCFDVLFPRPYPPEMLFDILLIGLGVPLLVNGITESLSLYGAWEAESVKNAQLEKENISAKYEILKNQINPHFLFNCFNALSELISEGKDMAAKFVQQLAHVYRYVLDNRNMEVIDLEDELQALRSYVFLMQIRFGDNLRVDWNLGAGSNHYGIVPLTTQILLENALKHNEVSAEHPLRVRIELTDDNKLAITNSMRKRTGNVGSTKVGLQNIINRYKYVAGKNLDIIETAAEFTVKAPLFEIQRA